MPLTGKANPASWHYSSARHQHRNDLVVSTCAGPDFLRQWRPFIRWWLPPDVQLAQVKVLIFGAMRASYVAGAGYWAYCKKD